MKVLPNNIKSADELIELKLLEIKKSLRRDLNSCDNKKERKELRTLSHKRYDEIYTLFGQKAYLLNVSESIRKKNLDYLFQNGKFLEIFDKHGKNISRSMKKHILAKDIEYETGSKLKGKFYTAQKNLARRLKRILAVVVSIFVGGNYLLAAKSESTKEQNFQDHSQEITEYLDSIDKYAEEVKAMKLTDTQVIMKVIDDMWSNIKGYGVPRLDLWGYQGLDLANSDGIGVCMNMADDCARKYNAINPDYNAKIIGVETTDNKKVLSSFEEANVKINIITPPHASATESNQIMVPSIVANAIKDTLGDHVVIMMSIPEDNTTLIVDPTNPSIGFYKDGEINMFNSKNKEEPIYTRKLLSEPVIRDFDALEFPKEYVKSFSSNDFSYEYLEKKFGIKAQNDALSIVRLQNPRNNFLQELARYYEEQGIDFHEELEKIGTPSVDENHEIFDYDRDR